MPNGAEDCLNPYLSLNYSIAKGVQLAFTLLYLGSLYTRLDECVGNIVQVFLYDAMM